MFRITAETLRQFTLPEILLLLAMNIETSRPASESRVPPDERRGMGTALSSWTLGASFPA